YAALPEGDYVLRVKATNKAEMWDVPDYHIPVHVAGPFWKTWWFYTLIFLVISGAGYLAYRFRLRQIMRVQEMRNQISRDLHDDVGSALSSISVYSVVAKKMAEDAAPATLPVLQSIGDSA